MPQASFHYSKWLCAASRNEYSQHIFWLKGRNLHPDRSRPNFFHAGDSEIHRSAHGSRALHAHWLSPSRIYCAFRGSLRDYLRLAGSDWTLYQNRDDSATHHYLDSNCDNQDSGNDPARTGILVHGQRCAHRFRHADVSPIPSDFWPTEELTRFLRTRTARVGPSPLTSPAESRRAQSHLVCANSLYCF